MKRKSALINDGVGERNYVGKMLGTVTLRKTKDIQKREWGTKIMKDTFICQLC